MSGGSKTTSSSSSFQLSRSIVEGFIVSGAPVEKINLSCSGIDFEVITYGATISSLKIEGTEVTIGHAGESAGLYKTNTNYMGCIAGRCANRICNGRFSIDGHEYNLNKNNGPNALHGGLVGFDKRNWTCDDIIITESETESKAAVLLSLYSADGEEGYPGHMNVQVVYEIDRLQNSLTIYKNAVCSKPSPVNLTNHAYWNLSGGVRSIKEHTLWLNCDHYLPVNAVQIPTGAIQDVRDPAHSHFDLYSREGGRRLAEVIPYVDGGGQPGLDHCFVVNQGVEIAATVLAKSEYFTKSETETTLYSGSKSEFFQRKPNEEEDGIPMFHYRYNEGPYPALHEAACLTDPVGGLAMRIYTTQPGLQVYTGNFLPPSAPPSDGPAYFALMTQHNAVCLETQHFPDAINQVNFHPVVIQPGFLYRHYSSFKFGKM